MKRNCVIVVMAILFCSNVFAQSVDALKTNIVALNQVLKSSGLPDRLKLYDAYFRLEGMNDDANRAIYPVFKMDFEAMNAVDQIRWVERFVANDKAFQSWDSSKQWSAKNLTGMEGYFNLFYNSTNVALLTKVYANLPYVSLKWFDLNVRQIKGFRSVLSNVLRMMPDEAVWSVVIPYMAKWPQVTKQVTYSWTDMRECLNYILERKSEDFVKYTVSVQDFDSEEGWNQTLKQKLTQKEWTLYLATLFRPDPDDWSAAKLKAAGWMSKNKEAWMKKLADSGEVTARLAYWYYQKLLKPELDFEKIRPYKNDTTKMTNDIVRATNDLVGFFLFGLLNTTTNRFSDATILRMMDKNRPILTASLIDELTKRQSYSSIGYMTNFLSTSNETLTLSAINAIARLGAAKYINIIIALCRSPYKKVKEKAIYAMVNVGNEDCVKALMTLLYDKAQSIRINAIEALGAIRSATPVDTLCKILSDANETEDIRAACAEALGKIGDRRAIPTMVSVLNASGNSSYTARIRAAEFLGQLRESSALGALLRNISTNRYDYLNETCIHSIGLIDNPDGKRQLIPILKRNLKGWKNDSTEIFESFWAIGDYRDVTAVQIANEVFESNYHDPKEFRYILFMAAYYLTHYSTTNKLVWHQYISNHLKGFLIDKAHYLSLLVRKTGEKRYLTAFAQLLPEVSPGYDGWQISWMLSAMSSFPDSMYLDTVPAVFEQTGESVNRDWAMTVIRQTFNSCLRYQKSFTPVDINRMKSIYKKIPQWLENPTTGEHKWEIEDLKTGLESLNLNLTN